MHHLVSNRQDHNLVKLISFPFPICRNSITSLRCRTNTYNTHRGKSMGPPTTTTRYFHVRSRAFSPFGPTQDARLVSVSMTYGELFDTRDRIVII